MSLVAVAKKDFQDAVRSRMLLGLTALFVLFAAGATYLFEAIPEIFAGAGNAPTIALLSGLSSPTGLLVPLIALVVGYKAIIGERESGSLKLLLGLPHTRRDVVLGKLVGRAGVVTVSIVVGFAAGAVVALVFYDSFAVVEFAVFTVLAIVYGLVFIAIAIGFSAGLRSSSYAVFGAVGLYALFVFVWDIAVLLLRYVVNGFSLPDVTTTPDWVALISLFNPQTAFNYGVAAAIPALEEFIPTASGDAVYLQNWFGFVILALWIVVPLLVGYARFNSTDL